MAPPVCPANAQQHSNALIIANLLNFRLCVSVSKKIKKIKQQVLLFGDTASAVFRYSLPTTIGFIKLMRNKAQHLFLIFLITFYSKERLKIKKDELHKLAFCVLFPLL